MIIPFGYIIFAKTGSLGDVSVSQCGLMKEKYLVTIPMLDERNIIPRFFLRSIVK